MSSDFKKIGRIVVSIDPRVCLCIFVSVGVCLYDRKRPRLTTHHRTVSWKNRLRVERVSLPEKSVPQDDAEKLY